MDALSLRESLFAKLTAHGVKPNALIFSSISSKRRGTEAVIRATGQGSDPLVLAALQSALTPEEQAVKLELSFGVSKGDACPDLEVFSTDGSATASKLKFAAEDSCVYLLDFWATWCPPCQAPMAHNQEMLVQNPSWKQQHQVDIVCISLDSEVEALNQRIRSKGWTAVTSVWAGPRGFEASAPSAFNVQGIPTCALVHRGRVRWIGHPTSIELEEAIKALIAGDEATFQAVLAAGESDADDGKNGDGDDDAEGGDGDDDEGERISHEVYVERMSKAEALLAAVIDSAAEQPAMQFALKKFEFVTILRRKLTPHSDSGTSYHVALIGTAPDAASDLLQTRLIPSVTELFPSLNDAVALTPMYSIQRLPQCSLCSKDLSISEPQYLCVECFDEDESRSTHAHCEACQQAAASKPGLAFQAL